MHYKSSNCVTIFSEIFVFCTRGLAEKANHIYSGHGQQNTWKTIKDKTIIIGTQNNKLGDEEKVYHYGKKRFIKNWTLWSHTVPYTGKCNLS